MLQRQHSDFWAGDILKDIFRGRKSNSKDLDLDTVQQLNRVRESIANFITILTGKNIRVIFKNNEEGMSYLATTEKSSYIVISSDVSDGNFDSTVGLACHEATHVVRSDMKMFATQLVDLPKFQSDAFRKLVVGSKMLNKLQTDNPNETVEYLIGVLWTNFGHKVLNWIEDRVIDNWQYKESPGYRGYYVALYDKYFYHEKDEEMLLSNFATDPSLQSYMYRFMTMMHPKANLNALEGLKDIHDLVDLPNIGRISSTKEAWNLSVEVMTIMLKHIEQVKIDPSKSKDAENIVVIMPNSMGSMGSGSTGQGEPIEIDEDTIIIDARNDPELAKKYMEAFKESLEKKEKMLDNNTKKEPVSKEQNDMLKNLENRTVDINNNGYSGKGTASSYSYGGSSGGGVDDVSRTIVVNRVTDAVKKSSLYGAFFGGRNNAAVTEGVRLGKLLAKKIQIRTDARVTPYTHRKMGKLDPRRIHAIRTGSDRLFYRTEVDTFSNITFWLSVDASGSMGGVWSDVITLATTIAYAASKVEGVDLVIDFRGNTTGSRTYPCAVIVYDSRRDHLSHFLELAKVLRCGSGTPEGLCIRGVEPLIPRPNQNLDSYFINISDGKPWMDTFNGTDALKYTKKLVRDMEGSGIGILGYFISTGYSGWDDFKEMYGAKNSHQLDARNVGQIARTINKLLMSSEKVG